MRAKLCYMAAVSVLTLVVGQGWGDPPRLQVGHSYNVAKASSDEFEERDYWVCSDAGNIAKAMRIPADVGFAERLADARMMDCRAISGAVPGAYRLTVLQYQSPLVQVRITTRNEASNNFVGWTDESFLESSPDSGER